ncbi:hypothetical protein A9264_04115 [Vibrio sp. UCD-FRSSP16_10]|uniref:AsmA family protein n=1 Tax=unclassified Vibrio TaxID=2614977 RepID=UPI0007FC4559|nr:MULTISPECIES: AsmA family protein [unclassified Vibrio]OBT10151.1 hypothetical protein A9260_05565 [Vibrio sp. UCD-FRSSP16_30]OBT18941.1 hypothetical protein A9264_04115 [Vibrio sp. UCD-FRSSP16_10]
MRAALKISGWFLLLLLTSCVALFLYLKTSHSNWLTQQVLSRVTSEAVSIGESHYQYPNTLTLSQVTIEQANNTAIAIDNVQITIDTHWDWSAPIVMSNIAISGVNLPHGISDTHELKQLFKQWQPQYIDVKGMDFANHDFIARDIHLTFTPSATFPEGDINIDSEQVYWKGEALDNFKARLNYQQDNTQLNLLSFNWRGGDIQLIAEQHGQSWTINDALIRNLHLSKAQFVQPEVSQTQVSLPQHLSLAELLNNIDIIEHIKVEQSSWQQDDLALNQVQLQLDHWSLKTPVWMQKSKLTFSAESVAWHEQVILEPQLSAQIEQQHIQFDQLSFLFEQGQFNTSGELSPEHLLLNELDVKNLEWSITDPQVSGALVRYFDTLKQIQINTLKVERSQIIDISNASHWQFSSLNAQGENLTVKQDNQWALWNGSFAASANSFTAWGITSIKPYLETQTVDGLWRIKQLFLPINDGLIKANSLINLGLISTPWELSVRAYGIPLKELASPLGIAVDWQGLTDVSADLNGLGGDELMLRHSLDGEINIAPHDVKISIPFATQPQHTVIIPEINIQAKRGIINVPETLFVSNNLTGDLQGSLDLVTPNEGGITLKIDADCVSLSSTLPKGRSQIAVTCPQP